MLSILTCPARAVMLVAGPSISEHRGWTDGSPPSTCFLSSGVQPLAASMNFLANAFSPRPSSAKSEESVSSSLFGSPSTTIEEAASSKDDRYDADGGSKDDHEPISSSKRSSAAPRSKSQFQLRYPPPAPKQRQRLHRRPKVLLQLHRVSHHSRPTPTYDVLPSSSFTTRLARKFPHTFKRKNGLGVDDLVVATSENYSTTTADADLSDDGAVDEKASSRDIVAAISQPPPRNTEDLRKAEICFNSGEVWIGSKQSKGGYEFVSTDKRGIKSIARWVPRRRGLRRPTSDALGISTPLQPDDWAFNFSLIDPCSRRHAVIATMDAQSINVSDSYTKPIVEGSAKTSDSTLDKSASPSASDSIEVDDALRTLIVITGIWVSFSEESTPHNDQLGPLPDKPSQVPTNHKRRSLSLNASKDSSSFASRSSEVVATNRPRPSLQQSGSTPLMSTSPTAVRSPFPPRRTQSVSAAFMRRANSRRIPFTPSLDSDATSFTEDSPSTRESSTSLGKGEGASEMVEGPPPPTKSGDKAKGRKSKVFGKLFGSNKKE